jgi:pilus assembly protein CpaF
MQDIFTFDRSGLDQKGKVHGLFRGTGTRPRFADRLATAGYPLRPELFASQLEV